MFHRRYILSGTAAGSLAALGFQVSETSAKARAIVATPGMKTSDPATAKALNAVFDATFTGAMEEVCTIYKLQRKLYWPASCSCIRLFIMI